MGPQIFGNTQNYLISCCFYSNSEKLVLQDRSLKAVVHIVGEPVFQYFLFRLRNHTNMFYLKAFFPSLKLLQKCSLLSPSCCMTLPRGQHHQEMVTDVMTHLSLLRDVSYHFLVMLMCWQHICNTLAVAFQGKN